MLLPRRQWRCLIAGRSCRHGRRSRPSNHRVDPTPRRSTVRPAHRSCAARGQRVSRMHVPGRLRARPPERVSRRTTTTKHKETTMTQLEELATDRATEIELVPTPLLPEGYVVPASRFTHPSTRMRQLLETEPYLFGPGVYDPMAAQLVMYHGFKAVYFSRVLVRDGPPRDDRHGHLRERGDRRRCAANGVGATQVPANPWRSATPKRGRAEAPRDPARNRRHGRRLRKHLQRAAHGRAVRQRRRCCRPHRGPGAAQALRSHRRQGAHPRVGDDRQAPHGARRRRRLGNEDFVIIARTDGLSAVDAPEPERGLDLAVDGPAATWTRASRISSGASSRPRIGSRWRRSPQRGPPRFPDARFAFNWSSSFKWFNDPDPITFAELGELGFKFIFITLGGQHAMGHGLSAARSDGRRAGAGLHRASARGVGRRRRTSRPGAITSSRASRITTSSARISTRRGSGRSSPKIYPKTASSRYESVPLAGRKGRGRPFLKPGTAHSGRSREGAQREAETRASSSLTSASARSSRSRFSGAFSHPLAPDGCGSGIATASPSRRRVPTWSVRRLMPRTRLAARPPTVTTRDGRRTRSSWSSQPRHSSSSAVDGRRSPRPPAFRPG